MKTHRLLRAAPTLLLAAAALACDSPAEVQLGFAPVTLEAVGDVVQLEANVKGSDHLPRWESLNPEVVTVTEAGMAVAVRQGTATVTARIGSKIVEGTVTVLEPVHVEVTNLQVVEDGFGQPGMRMRLKNLGGRGYFRLEFWKQRAGPGEEHQRVLYWGTDGEAPVGLDIEHSSFILDEPADWVVAYSREPQSLTHTSSSCVRLDGGLPCPMD